MNCASSDVPPSARVVMELALENLVAEIQPVIPRMGQMQVPDLIELVGRHHLMLADAGEVRTAYIR